jgi:hypothetical protein
MPPKAPALNTAAAAGSVSGTAETDRTGKTTSKKSGKSPRAASPRSNPLGGAPKKAGGSSTPRAGASSSSSSSSSATPRGSKKTAAAAKPGAATDRGGAAAKAGGKEPAATDRGGKAGAKPSAQPLASIADAGPSSSSSGAPQAENKKAGGPLGPNAKKIEYLSEELLSRKPLEAKAYEALIKKAGQPKQEVRFERNENHRPIGRPDELTPSRHERIPPTFIVLMFNCYEASFELTYGDISTLPESDTTELRSLTSGKSLGRVKITPEKGTRPQPQPEQQSQQLP